MSSTQSKESAVTSESIDTPEDRPVILFDGVCNFCDAWVQFVIRRDRDRIFRFSALQSPTGQKLLEQFQMPIDELSTMVLIDGNRSFVRSSAALRILSRLRWPWPILQVLLVVPAFLRDPVYNSIAKRRYRWFGKKQCLVLPVAEQRDRFLE